MFDLVRWDNLKRLIRKNTYCASLVDQVPQEEASDVSFVWQISSHLDSEDVVYVGLSGGLGGEVTNVKLLHYVRYEHVSYTDFGILVLTIY